VNIYFVIDTNMYAGNFEREMCAYMTGQLGECGVGEEEAAAFEEEFDEDLRERMDDLIGSECDDRGCTRPVKIYPSPNWFNHGHGGHFRHDDPDLPGKAQEHYDQAILEWADHVRKVYAHMPEYAEEQAKERLAYLGTPFSKHPAYMSVAICLEEEPTPEEIEFFKERAHKFAKNYRTSWGNKPCPFEIEGFRLVRERIVAEEVAL